jgi:hypothetical protein
MTEKKLVEILHSRELPSLRAGTAADLLEAFYEAVGRISDVGTVMACDRALVKIAEAMNGEKTYTNMKLGRRLGGGSLFWDEDVKGIKILSSDASEYIMIHWTGDR